MAEKDKFNPANIGGVTGAFRQYSSQDLNGFKITGWLAGYAQYPWQDIWGRGKAWRKKELVNQYKLRSFFYSHYKFSKPFVLNAEELATIYHLPGAVASTPTLGRVPSKKSEAPSNLPM